MSIFRNNVDNLQDTHIVDHQDFSCYCMAIHSHTKCDNNNNNNNDNNNNNNNNKYNQGIFK